MTDVAQQTRQIANRARAAAMLFIVACIAACVAFYTLVSAAAGSKPLVILVRHGNAPGSGEPEGFTLAKCNTQRNLSDKGRKQASEIGNALRVAGIDVIKVMASELCRTRQTAELMRIGQVESSPAFDDLADNPQQASDLLSREWGIIQAWHGPGALVIVTHGSNIKALTGLHVAQGGMVDVEKNYGQLAARLFPTRPE
jgi:phosphohistidine phosphatase SixA